MRALAVDVGSTSVRTALVDEHGELHAVHQARLAVRSDQPGEVELDPGELADTCLSLSAMTIAEGGPAAAVGVATQRATTILFDRATLEPLGPALSWQDLRTVIDCLVLQGEGLRLAPNQSATKAAWLLRQSGREASDLAVATVETWVALTLSEGRDFLTDHSNAAVTGLLEPSTLDWDDAVLDRLGLRREMLARIVPTCGELGVASALEGSPPITALVGDQSASLYGQGVVLQGAKLTLGTGAMLDCVSPSASGLERGTSGCFPIVASSRGDVLRLGVEAIALSAGACLEWLVDVGLVGRVEEVDALAASVPDSAGVTFVPALQGLGTPYWDFGARAGFLGLTRGVRTAHLARAVLEGVAQRGADLLAAARAETGLPLQELRVDGGLAASGLVVSLLADLADVRVELSTEREATARGAGLMALVGAHEIDEGAVEQSWRPARVLEPVHDAQWRSEQRERWTHAIDSVRATLPELSAISF